MEKYREKLVKTLKNLSKDTKEIIKFETIALSIFSGRDLTNFTNWMRSNEEIIVSEFEKLCRDYNCICQKCYVGPLQGNYWVTRSWKS